jgi:BMFP domain-containing protein YqiC
MKVVNVMPIRPNFMSDLAQMANGAASAFVGMRQEIDNMIRQRLERSLNARGLVTREDFDALLTRHEALAARIAALESTGPTYADSARGKAVSQKAQKLKSSKAKITKKKTSK